MSLQALDYFLEVLRPVSLIYIRSLPACADGSMVNLRRFGIQCMRTWTLTGMLKIIAQRVRRTYCVYDQLLSSAFLSNSALE